MGARLGYRNEARDSIGREEKGSRRIRRRGREGRERHGLSNFEGEC